MLRFAKQSCQCKEERMTAKDGTHHEADVQEFVKAAVPGSAADRRKITPGITTKSWPGTTPHDWWSKSRRRHRRSPCPQSRSGIPARARTPGPASRLHLGPRGALVPSLQRRVCFQLDNVNQFTERIQGRHRRCDRHLALFQNCGKNLAGFLEGGIRRKEFRLPGVFVKQDWHSRTQHGAH